MITLVRIDDRLLHGQIICAWVPYAGADLLVVASDEAAGDELAEGLMKACASDALDVAVKRVDDVKEFMAVPDVASKKAILIFGDLKDAERAYKGGLNFSSLNLGNIHHDGGGRTITPSVIVDGEDERIIEGFIACGVSIDIRNVPGAQRVEYRPVKNSGL
ncbi:MAG: PTS sugar transporter subunit IIB [Thermodesulfobacteriota bacterium]